MYFRKECFVLSLLMLCIPVVVYAGDADQARVSDVAGDLVTSGDLDSQKGAADGWPSGDDFCDAGCVEPAVGNYNSLIVSGLGLDLLLYGRGHSKAPDNGARLPVYTFDFSNLFRFNVHYLRAVRIAGSRFAFCFGGGFRTVLYAFPRLDSRNNVIQAARKSSYGIKRALPCMASGDLVTLGGDQESDARVLGSMDAGDVETYYCSVKRSVLALDYLDFLLRLRFNTNLEFPKSGFFTWVGLRVGYLLSAKSLIKYEETGQSNRIVDLVRCGDFGGINNKVSCLGELGFGYARVGVGVSCDAISLFKSPRGGRGNSDLLSRYGLSVGLMVDLV